MSLLRACVVLVVLLSLQMELGESSRGVDVSTYISENNCACIRSANDILIMRAYRITGEPDPNAPGTIANCKSIGFQYLDVYLFPCPRCGKSASQQVSEMGKSACNNEVLLKALCLPCAVIPLRNLSYGRIWLHIEVRNGG